MSGDNIEQRNGWNEWSKHVLLELERLNNGIDNLHTELQDVKSGMQQIAVVETQLLEIKTWKKEMNDVVSPAQFKDIIKLIDDLKNFKTKAITVFAVIQTIIATVLMALAAA